ncbi:DUF1778 domain-containing protein [Endozoicomonas sp. OPT23]|uniref:type II toxin-antitoxin system TacA family antitoxin n=1 Tax=Endozoicomonas sp. OPT23 TaxID=2072845 RepID=UPI00129A3A3C|nr:DUF1778 domain-containing protein [Endozoicomonas sp. OPT23]MRI34905.1 DUF1778 domain-containing protein [Endozoicomonas sp. OPT23]
MATERLDLRLDEEIKAKAEKASALLGLKSLTEYVVKLIDEDSTQVIEQYESITFDDDLFDRFTNACEQAKVPNDPLKEALAFTEKKGVK